MFAFFVLPNGVISMQPNREMQIADLRQFRQLGKIWNHSRAAEELE
jgi:hypothetical protein